MLGFLAGLPGQISALMGRLTEDRADYLDKLNITGNVASATTALTNAVWTDTKAGYLDAAISSRATPSDLTPLAKENTPLLDPPIASGIQSGQLIALSGHPNATGLTPYHITGQTSYVNVVNYTGQGVLNFLSGSTSGAYQIYIKLTIDGVVVIEAATGVSNYDCISPVGCYNNSAISLDQIPFKTSLLIQARSTNPSGYGYCHYKYRKTA